MFPYALFDVPGSFRDPQDMDEDGRRRAGAHATAAMSRRGWDPSHLAAQAGLDVATVRDLLRGDRWARVGTRNAVEVALGMAVGELDMVARGYDHGVSDVDPVEQAIDESPLSRADRAALKAHYFTMLDKDEGRRGA